MANKKLCKSLGWRTLPRAPSDGRFSAWRQKTGSAVLDVSEGGKRPGRPQTVIPRRENASVTPGTTSDNYFRFAAATVEIGGEGPD